jgi:hypothetical protein
MKTERKRKLQFILGGSALSLVLILAVCAVLALMSYQFITTMCGIGWDREFWSSVG